MLSRIEGAYWNRGSPPFGYDLRYESPGRTAAFLIALRRRKLRVISKFRSWAVQERRLRGSRNPRGTSVREFFGLANLHMRWELNDLARRVDERTPPLGPSSIRRALAWGRHRRAGLHPTGSERALG